MRDPPSKSDLDNRSQQLDRQNERYWESRGMSHDEAASRAAEVWAENQADDD